jgi:hypothetical protein
MLRSSRLRELSQQLSLITEVMTGPGYYGTIDGDRLSELAQKTCASIIIECHTWQDEDQNDDSTLVADASNCKNCQQKFASRSNKKYCSNQCRSAWHYKKAQS